MTNLTQEERVFQYLYANLGKWVSGQYFLRTMYLSQYHRAIHNIEHNARLRARLGIDGFVVEHSDFNDEHGFKSYRLTLQQ